MVVAFTLSGWAQIKKITVCLQTRSMQWVVHVWYSTCRHTPCNLNSNWMKAMSGWTTLWLVGGRILHLYLIREMFHIDLCRYTMQQITHHKSSDSVIYLYIYIYWRYIYQCTCILFTSTFPKPSDQYRQLANLFSWLKQTQTPVDQVRANTG